MFWVEKKIKIDYNFDSRLTNLILMHDSEYNLDVMHGMGWEEFKGGGQKLVTKS